MDPTVVNIDAPDAPVATAGTDLTSTSFSANWLASARATGYYLDVSTDPTFATGVVQVALSSSYTQWTIINLLANTNYYVRIKTSTSVSVDCCTSITLNFKTLTA
jgi:hypothetical protein